MPPSKSFSVACLSFDQIGRLLWSQAYARAVFLHSRAEWKPYKESTFLNVAYTLMPWSKGPGWMEVEQDFKRVESHAKELFSTSVDGFIKVLNQGPAAMAQYLSDAERVRNESLQAVSALFASVQNMNANTIQETGTTIKYLAATKASATVILAGCGAGIALAGSGVGLVAGAANLSFSVTKAVVKNWGELKVVSAVAIELAKEKLPEVSKNVLQARGVWTIWQTVPKWEEARQQVMKTSATLAKKTSSQKRAKLGRKLINAQKELAHAESQAAKGAKMMSVGKNLGKYLPVVFAVSDVLEAVSDYEDDVKGL